MSSDSVTLNENFLNENANLDIAENHKAEEVKDPVKRRTVVGPWKNV